MKYCITLSKHISTQKTIGVLLFGVLFPVLLASQQLTLSRIVMPKTISERNIKVLCEDSYGFIWMGGAGLHKYDGYTSKSYIPVGTDSLSNRMGIVYDLLETKEGNLWIAAYEGLFFYNRNTDEVGKAFADHIERIFPTIQRIFTLFEDSQGRIWIGGETGLALMTLEQDTTFQLLHKIENKGEQHSEGVRGIREDSKGKIWVATTEGLWEINRNLTIQYYEPEIQKRKRKMSFRIIDSEISKGDTLWLATAEHLWLFDIPNKAFSKIALPAYDNSAVRELLLDENNYLWIATRNNILVRYPNGNFRWIAGYPSYQFGGINTLLKDRFGNLWAGSNVKVSYLNLVFDRMLPHFQITNGPPAQDNAIYRVVEDSAGGFWFRMLRSGLGYSPYLGGNFEILLQPPNNLFLDEIKDLCVDGEGNVWVITLTNGLYYFEKGSKNYRQFDFGDSLKVSAPWSIQVDNENDQLLWISTKFGLLALNRITLQRNWYSPKNDLPWLENNTVGPIEIDSYGHIWGFLRVNSKWIIGYFDKKNRRYQADPDLVSHLSSTRIYPIKRVNKEEVWASTNRGLIIINTKQKTQTYLSEKKDLPFRNVNSISPDAQGNVWLNTGSKLCKYNGTRFDCFNLPGEMRGSPRSSATLTKDKKVVFGIDKGLLVFDPKSLEKDSIVPKVVLTDFRVFNESVNLGQAFELVKTITLPFRDNVLSFGFSALHFHHIEGVKYRYKLEGFDKKWKELSDKEQRVTYTNLSPGVYTFKVLAANTDGFWTPEAEGLSTQLKILPPWYRTWWAYLMYAIIIGIVLQGIRRYEIRRKLSQAEAEHFKELDLVKSQLYTNITHEFRTPLTIILGMAEQVKGDPRNWFNEGLELIKRNGKQLLNLVNQLLDLSKLESGKMPLNLVKGDIVSFLQYLTESFHSFADSKDIRLHFMSGLTELQMDYDPEKLQQVVSNLISNAIKFTPAGGDVYIGVAVANGQKEVGNNVRSKQQSTSNHLLLTIKDTGIGIATENLPHIFDRFYQVDASHTRRGEGTGIGLALTGELVRALGGSIDVESVIEKGTKFTILLPINQTVKNNQPERVLELPHTLADALILDREGQYGINDISQRNQHLVLLVEDNEDILTYLCSFLSNNYQIVTAANGKEGIEKALDLIPDLIVSDVMMPEKDGFEVCAVLKKAERTSHIPIILLTAKSDQTSKLDGLRQGADAYLAKPFHKEELLVRMEKLIALRLQLQERFQKTGTLRQILNNSSPTKEEVFLQKVLQIIEKNLKDENFGMPQLCKELHLSRSHLFRKLKALTDKSATHLIRSMRLEKGKKLLETTHLNVSEVCFEVGFSNVAYFSRVFQEKYGSPPSVFQKT